MSSMDVNVTIQGHERSASNMLGCAFLLLAARCEVLGSPGFQEAPKKSWAICGIAGLLFWPTSVLGFVKVGAGPSTLIYSTYFLSLGLLLLAFEGLNHTIRPAFPMSQVAVGLVLLLQPLQINHGYKRTPEYAACRTERQ